MCARKTQIVWHSMSWQERSTNRCCNDRVRLVLMGLQSPVEVCCGMQRSRPDQPQTGEMRREESQLADETVHLDVTSTKLQVHAFV